MDSNIICIELDNVSKTKKAEVQIMEIKTGWKSPYALGRQGSKVKIDPEEVVWMMSWCTCELEIKQAEIA